MLESKKGSSIFMVKQLHKSPRSKIDTALSKLTTEQFDEWANLVKFNANYSTLISFLEESNEENKKLGIKIHNVSTWWIKNRPRGKDAIALNVLAEKYQGVEPERLAEMSLGVMGSLVELLWASIGSDEVESTRPATKLTNLIEALKEMRLASNEFGQNRLNSTNFEVELAGALKMAEKLKVVFRESPFSGALNTAINGVLSDWK